jgi:hypothetical protein
MGRISTIEDGVGQVSVRDGVMGDMSNGIITITAGNTLANFSHGLGAIPRGHSVSAQDDNGADWKVTAVTASIITVAIPVPQIGNAVFYISATP